MVKVLMLVLTESFASVATFAVKPGMPFAESHRVFNPALPEAGLFPVPCGLWRCFGVSASDPVFSAVGCKLFFDVSGFL